MTANMVLAAAIASSPYHRSASWEKIHRSCERIYIITTALGSPSRIGTKKIVSLGATGSQSVCCWSSKGFPAGRRRIVLSIKKEWERDISSACVEQRVVVVSSELAFALCGVHGTLI